MSAKKKLSIVRNVLLFAVIAWFLVAFMIVPVISVFKEVFFTEGGFSLNSITKLMESSRVKKALTNSYVMAFWTVITVTIVGLFQILVTEYFDIKGSRFLGALFMTPLVYSSISLVRGYNYMYSANGLLTKMLVQVFPGLNPNWFTGFTGVLFVHTFSMTTYLILFVKTAFRGIDYSTIEASKSMGASSMKTFFKVALPVVKPALFSATILLILGALNSFAAPSMLGGQDFYMINSMILALNGLRSYDLSALLSLILAFTCIVLLLVMRWLEKRNSYISVSKVPTKLRKTKIRNPFLNILMHILSYAMMLVYLLPILGIVMFSFADDASIATSTLPSALTLDNYIRVFTNSISIRPFVNSVKLSLLAVAMVMFITMISAVAIHKKPGKATTILEMTLLIPWILPATMLVVGMITTYATPNLLAFGYVLLGGFWLLPIAYTVNSVPSAMRLVRASLFTVNDAHEEASRSLGGGAFYTFRRVVLPAMMPTAISVAAITFNGLLAEYTITALLYNVNNVPLGIFLRSPNFNPDPHAEATTLVYIVILMVISSITLIATQKYRNKN